MDTDRGTLRERRITYSVESVVNKMFEIFAHSDLLHQLVFVSVHSSQLSHVGKYVLQSICQLEAVQLHMRSTRTNRKRVIDYISNPITMRACKVNVSLINKASVTISELTSVIIRWGILKQTLRCFIIRKKKYSRTTE